jgi:hypothetical protein
MPLFFGCAASQMGQLKQQHYSSWPPHIQHAVDNKTIIPGMDKLQVQIATGVGANLINKRTTFVDDAILETWVLYKSMGGCYFMDPGFSSMVLISFRDGIVESVSF